ncbi:MAG TPA: GMC family oxidoreductase N-terminal domain-containing protein [Usitatibacteraceae bacterium]|nr:GMC family oxidoreductase N-terminal domain-containing protein [Usitatibacteraceae bacterium]
MRLDQETFDYVIVGAGSAGCVLANRLSADPDVRVLLLEAGGQDDWIWIHIPVGYLFCIGNPRTDWCYRTEPCAGLNGRSILYARGKVLGGCSSINAMVYMRGQAADYDRWAAAGNPGWSWDDVLPVFKQSEDHYGGGSAIHGAGGEWRVEEQRLSWTILDAWRDAAEQCGIAKIADFNGGDNEGSARFQVNQRTGVRWSTSKAFLRPVLGRSNLVVRTGVYATRVLMETRDGRRRALGIAYEKDGARHQVLAARETLLAAGAINSPQLLQLSGIGPARLLQRHGIDFRHDLPGVGENLQDHLQLRMAFKVHGVKTLNRLANTWWGKAQMGLQYALFRSGPLTMAPSQLGAFVKSDPAQSSANLEYHIQPVSLDKFGDPPHKFPAFTASVCNLRPESRGHVSIRSNDAHDPPLIQPNYLSTEGDRRVAIDALRLTRRIAQAPALARYTPEEFMPGPAYDSDDALVTAAGNIGTTIFHPVGTCKMGPAGDPGAVVDARLKVHGIEALRVVDASIMPTIVSGNTNSPVIMIAERGAAMIRQDRLAGRT